MEQDRVTQLAIQVARLEEQNTQAGTQHAGFTEDIRDLREAAAAALEWRSSVDRRLQGIEEALERLRRNGNGSGRRQAAVLGGTGGSAAGLVLLVQYIAALL